MIDIKVPELAESVTEGTVAEWLKELGEYVEKGDNLVELETDKVNVEVPAEAAGILQTQHFQPGDTVKVGDVIASLDEKAQESSASESSDGASETPSSATKTADTAAKADKDTAEKEESPASETEKDDSADRGVASPAARKYAREQGISLNEIVPRDPLGRIKKDDIDEHVAKSSEKAPSADAEEDQDDPAKPVERIRMSRRRKTIANRLVEAQQTAAMLTTFNEVDMTNLMALRNRWKEKFQEEQGVKLGFMSFFTKAVVGALKKYPYVNAEIDGDEVILKKYYDVSIAVSTEEGLVVPVVRDADRLDFAGIENEVNRLAQKAHDKKLAIDELQGGSFTITNGGVFGSLWSTPILNAPQVGILGMHKTQMRPVAIDNENFENRPMMYIALSYDHRIIDGKDAVGFLVKVKELIENPEALLLEG